MNFDYVFVLTYGRSGSTLLQGVLNSINGVEVKGENGAALRGLFDSVMRLVDSKRRFSELDSGPDSPWYGISRVNVDRYVESLGQAFAKNVLNPEGGAKVLGFKEIRYHDANLVRELELFRRFFRRPAFIVNTRNLHDAIQSNVLAGHAVKPDEIRDADRALREIVSMGHRDVFHVHYDDYRSNPKALRPMFEFLGAPFDERALFTVFERRHSTVTGTKPAALGGV